MSDKLTPVELEDRIRELEGDISKLKEHQSLYKVIFDNSPEVIVYVDLSGKVVNVNKRVFEWIKYKPEEIIGKKFVELEFMSDKTRNLIMDKFSIRLRGENISPYSIEVNSKDGEKLIGQVVAQPLKDDMGKMLGSLTLISDITGQYEQTKMFKEASKRSAALFNTIPDLMFIIDKDGKYTDFKAETREELAVPPEEIIGKNIRETGFSNKYLALINSHIKKALKKNEIQTFEYELNTPLERGVYECRMIGLNDKEVLSIVRNITEQKKSEVALRESEKKYRSLLEHNIDAVFIFDLDGIIFEVNNSGTEMLGYNSKEIIGSHISKITSDKESYDSEMRINALLKGEILPVYERTFVKKDGSEFPAEVNISLIHDSDGKPIHFQSIVRDITLRKQAALDIEKRQKYLELFLNAIPEAIITLDSSHKIIDWNPGAEKIFGYKPEEVTGINIDKLITNPDTIEEANRFTKKILSGMEISPHETVRYRKDGSPVNVLLSGSLIKIRGELQGIVALYIDISMQKKIEEELRKADKLESLALLAGGIAHDFNNILASISVNLGLFDLYKDNPPKLKLKLKGIESAIFRAKGLTQQLLTFSKGNTPIKNTISIIKLLEETVKFALSGSNVKCKFSIKENLRDVEIDEGQISQVIQNIVINAVQAMPEGGIFKVKAENANKNEIKKLPLKGDRYIKIEFQDQGIGIPKSHLKNIFDPFFTTKQKGGGLGLATTFSIIKNHDGLITVESKLGSSTTFFIYLPASEKRTIAKLNDSDKIIQGSGRVLLMDDDEMILNASGELLKHLGYRVFKVKDGKEAIKLYKDSINSKTPFDCVILDLTIPDGMGGKDTLNELIKIDPDVKAIASSGYSIDPIISDYKKFGFSGAIPKPYVISDLSAVIDRVINYKN